MSDVLSSLLSLTSPAGAEALVPIRLHATETISELFRFEVNAIAAAAIDPTSMLNQAACVTLKHAGTAVRYFHGVIAEFGAVGQPGVVGTEYRIVLLPRLAEAGLQQDCRMFFNKTADAILKTLFSDAGVTDTAFRLYGAAVARDATAQYNETSLHFATRLMEEEGWYYFFEHAADSHTLVVTDSNTGFGAIKGATLRFGTGGTAGVTSDLLTSWYDAQVLTHGQVSLRDYDPDAPDKQLSGKQQSVLKHGGAANREVFHWPALTRKTSDVAGKAKFRMEAAEAAVSLVQASSSFGSLVAGGRFAIADASGATTSYVARRVEHVATDDSLRASSGAESYSNTFTAFPNAVPWRQPMATARPRMEGLHTAIVLAPSGDEIHTDDQGRIKVRFFWDWREDATADSSAWVRVVQPWAGNGWGGQFIARVGTEVAVAFMDADPDRPVVMGGFYNGSDKPIFSVGEKTKTGFRSRSVLKGGTDAFNEFSFNDDKDKEVVFLHAQKDLTTEVENDETHSVDHDRTLTVKGKETLTVKGDRAREVSDGNDSVVVKKGNQTIEVTAGDQSTTVKGGNQTIEVTTGDQSTTLKKGNQVVVLTMGNQSTEAKLGDVSIKADMGAITLEALKSITLKVGQNSLTLSPTGVELKGMMVSIQGQISTEVKGLMVTTQGTAMLTLKGAITMLN